METSNTSPRLSMLPERGLYSSLSRNETMDICIIGGGIAGCVTAYYLLQETSKHIAIVEGGKLAHGASGYNAGFATTHFQRGIPFYIEKYGLEKVINTQKGIFQAEKDLIDILQTLEKAGLPVSYSISEEILTYSDSESMYKCLTNIYNFALGGIKVEPLRVSPQVFLPEEVREKYENCYKEMSDEEIMKRAKYRGEEILAIEIRSVILINPVEFCEQIIKYMNKVYTTQFSVFEYTAVKNITIQATGVELSTMSTHTIFAKEVILCTNGFNTLSIQDNTTTHTWFKHLDVKGYITHMLGFSTQESLDSYAGVYVASKNDNPKTVFDQNPFHYISARDHKNSGIICVGSEVFIEDNVSTRGNTDMPSQKIRQLERLVTNKCTHTADKTLTHRYKRHGTIGYTPDGLRIVGKDQRHPRIRYNIGCNGIGILPSIYGAKKIISAYKSEIKPQCLFDIWQ